MVFICSLYSLEPIFLPVISILQMLVTRTSTLLVSLAYHFHIQYCDAVLMHMPSIIRQNLLQDTIQARFSYRPRGTWKFKHYLVKRLLNSAKSSLIQIPPLGIKQQKFKGSISWSS